MTQFRGRSSKPQNNRNPRSQNNHNRSFDSNGPDIKVRGTAAQVYEKYLQLARDANISGDRVAAENHLQHAEHYYRVMLAAQPSNQIAQRESGQSEEFNGNARNSGDTSGEPQTVIHSSEPE